ncbi:MAG: hypothetical protein MJK14_09810 [Rivularia sp. ALOHA_DT_140]|nr:hypothetical protein [Rivularia sp. ALOHA_DT_140]
MEKWIFPILGLILASAVAAMAAWFTSWEIARIWQVEGLFFDLVQLTASGI